AQRNESALRFRLGLFQDVLTIQRFHASIFSGLLDLAIAGAELLFAGGLGDSQIVQRGVAAGMHMLFIQVQLVRALVQAHGLAAGKDLMPAVLFIPLGERSCHVHLFNNVAPAHAGVVRAEADFALLGGVRNNALLSAAEVVVIKVLEPHSSNEQEVPTVGAALLDVVNRALARYEIGRAHV